MLSSTIGFRRSSALAVLTAFALTACSENPTSPSKSIAPGSANLSQSPEMMDATGRHIFHTKPWFDQAANGNGNGHGGGPPGGGSSTGISYHGGQVLLTGTNVVAVYWASTQIYNNGPTVGTSTLKGGAADGSLIGFFLSSLGASSYFNINSTYTDGGSNHIASVVNYNGYWANGNNAPSGTQSVSDAQMVAMLQAGFNSGDLRYDPSTLYAIFTAGKVNLGGGFGTQYCAYHTHGTVTINGQSKIVLYAAMPYNNAYPGTCTNGTAPPNGDAGADAEVNTLAHETEETTTDLMGNAWFDTRGYENADKCAWNWGPTSTLGGGVWNITVGGKHFLVQQNWVNVAPGGCAQGY